MVTNTVLKENVEKTYPFRLSTVIPGATHVGLTIDANVSPERLAILVAAVHVALDVRPGLIRIFKGNDCEFFYRSEKT